MSVSLQKANLWKRISAVLFDAVMTFVILLGLAIPVNSLLKYDEYHAEFSAIQQAYTAQAETDFGVDLSLSREEYEKHDEAWQADYDQRKADAETAIAENLEKDEEASRLSSKLISVLVITFCISSFLAFLIWYFIIPLLLKDGRTLGKKLFGIAVVRTNCVKISTPVLFVRSMIGLYAMETMAVLFLCLLGTVGIIAAVLVQVLQVWVLVKTPKQSIHDLLSDTIVVDYSSQQIFETQGELEEFLAMEKRNETPSQETYETQR